jgi:hypothetical protein
MATCFTSDPDLSNPEFSDPHFSDPGFRRPLLSDPDLSDLRLRSPHSSLTVNHVSLKSGGSVAFAAVRSLPSVRFRIRVKAVVRLLCALLLVLPFSFSAMPARAQVTATAPVTEQPQYTNRWDVYGGAQYSHFNPSPGRNFQAVNLLGWTGSAVVYFRPVWGIEASARGLYGTYDPPTNQYGVGNTDMSEHLFLFGPNFRLYRRASHAAGIHTLFGAAYGSFDKGYPSGVQPILIGVYNNKLAFGAALGGWYDYNLTPRFSVRVIGDWQPTRYGYTVQNEFAGSVGIVYKLGSLQK